VEEAARSLRGRSDGRANLAWPAEFEVVTGKLSVLFDLCRRLLRWVGREEISRTSVAQFDS
jgi:hypothetical protein